jgi:predicted anti-sigma-YlaC factor YlaD
MDCASWRELVSARLDGETSLFDNAALDEHLAGCPGCTFFSAQATRLHRLARLRPAEPVPDLTSAILRQAVTPAPKRWTARAGARLALAWMAVVQLTFAIPALLLGADSGASAHVARHVGAFDGAIAVGLLVAALQPRRARALLPLAIALASFVILGAALDVTSGAASLVSESQHLVDVLGVAALWVVAGTPWFGNGTSLGRDLVPSIV